MVLPVYVPIDLYRRTGKAEEDRGLLFVELITWRERLG